GGGLQEAGIRRDVSDQAELAQITWIDPDPLADAEALRENRMEDTPAREVPEHVLEGERTHPGHRHRQRRCGAQLDLVEVVTEHGEDLVGSDAAERAQIAPVDPGETGPLLRVPGHLALVEQLEHATLGGREPEARLADVVLQEEEAVGRERSIDLERQVLEVRDVVDGARAHDEVVALRRQREEIEIARGARDTIAETSRECADAPLDL